MGRWTQYDEDEYRLPEGMKRVGYDADSGKYYFRDQAGTLYEGAQGAEFGEMKRVSSAPIALAEVMDEDLEAAPGRSDGYAPLASEPNARVFKPTSPYRTLFPFFLIVVTFLLLVWRLFVVPSSLPPPKPCPENMDAYYLRKGDTCWEVARSRGIKLQDLLDANPKLECERLQIGARLCVPTKPGEGARRSRNTKW